MSLLCWDINFQCTVMNLPLEFHQELKPFSCESVASTVAALLDPLAGTVLVVADESGRTESIVVKAHVHNFLNLIVRFWMKSFSNADPSQTTRSIPPEKSPREAHRTPHPDSFKPHQLHLGRLVWSFPVNQKILNVSQSAHHFSFKSDCNSTADVPSFLLCSMLFRNSHLSLICVLLIQ